MKSLLLVACTGLVLAFTTVAPATATASTPCWRTLIDDWYDGKIDNTYPRSCYTQALQHLPQDVKDYSSARDDIERALLAVIRGGNGGDSGNGTKTPESVPPGTSASGNSSSPNENSHKGVILRAIEWLGPSNAGSVPLPLLILAGVAFLLLAAAGGSFVNRWLQERRMPPPPQA